METLTQIVFNRILGMFNLKIKEGKLFYEHHLIYGTIDFLVSILDEEGVRIMSNFLKLPYIPWGNDREDLFYSIANSPYFSKKVFLQYYTRHTEYNKFKEFLKTKNPISIFKPFNNTQLKLSLIDRHFDTTIRRSVNNLRNNNITKKNIRNNFNGHLVLNWVPELSPGKLLSETIIEFKEHIEKRFRTNFLEYVTNRPPNIIRLDFKFYYYDDFEFYEKENINELPF